MTDLRKIDWDAAKDRALWHTLSTASKGSEIQCIAPRQYPNGSYSKLTYTRA